MSGASKLDCLKRLAMVLVGRVEPSVEAVVEAAKGVSALANDPVSGALHRLYDGIVSEPVPQTIIATLNGAGPGPRHYVPSQGKGGKYGRRRKPH